MFKSSPVADRTINLAPGATRVAASTIRTDGPVPPLDSSTSRFSATSRVSFVSPFVPATGTHHSFQLSTSCGATHS